MSYKNSERPCMIIGEVAQAHDGSLGFAHAFIDAIANAGADAVKFQTHIAAAESTPGEPWRVKFSLQDESRWEYWRRMQFTEEQWMGLRKHAADRGLKFLSSPFSVEAAELLKRVEVDAWKIPSGEVNNTQLMECIAPTRQPVFLSTGMSPFSEIDQAVERIRRHGLPLTVLQCTTSYPCSPADIGLNLLSVFRSRYRCPVGLSDHSGTIFPGLAAVTLGIQVLEVHVTLSREMFGPDVTASVTTAELKQLVEGVRFIEAMKRAPADKDQQAARLQPVRSLFTKSIVAKESLPAGTTLSPDQLALRKPGTGIPADRIDSVIGRRLLRDIEGGELLRETDLAWSH